MPDVTSEVTSGGASGECCAVALGTRPRPLPAMSSADTGHHSQHPGTHPTAEFRADQHSDHGNSGHDHMSARRAIDRSRIATQPPLWCDRIV